MYEDDMDDDLYRREWVCKSSSGEGETDGEEEEQNTSREDDVFCIPEPVSIQRDEEEWDEDTCVYCYNCKAYHDFRETRCVEFLESEGHNIEEKRILYEQKYGSNLEGSLMLESDERGYESEYVDEEENKDKDKDEGKKTVGVSVGSSVSASVHTSSSSSSSSALSSGVSTGKRKRESLNFWRPVHEAWPLRDISSYLNEEGKFPEQFERDEGYWSDYDDIAVKTLTTSWIKTGLVGEFDYFCELIERLKQKHADDPIMMLRVENMADQVIRKKDPLGYNNDFYSDPITFLGPGEGCHPDFRFRDMWMTGFAYNMPCDNFNVTKALRLLAMTYTYTGFLASHLANLYVLKCCERCDQIFQKEGRLDLSVLPSLDEAFYGLCCTVVSLHLLHYDRVGLGKGLNETNVQKARDMGLFGLFERMIPESAKLKGDAFSEQVQSCGVPFVLRFEYEKKLFKAVPLKKLKTLLERELAKRANQNNSGSLERHMELYFRWVYFLTPKAAGQLLDDVVSPRKKVYKQEDFDGDDSEDFDPVYHGTHDPNPLRDLEALTVEGLNRLIEEESKRYRAATANVVGKPMDRKHRILMYRYRMMRRIEEVRGSIPMNGLDWYDTRGNEFFRCRRYQQFHLMPVMMGDLQSFAVTPSLLPVIMNTVELMMMRNEGVKKTETEKARAVEVQKIKNIDDWVLGYPNRDQGWRTSNLVKTNGFKMRFFAEWATVKVRPREKDANGKNVIRKEREKYRRFPDDLYSADTLWERDIVVLESHGVDRLDVRVNFAKDKRSVVRYKFFDKVQKSTWLTRSRKKPKDWWIAVTDDITYTKCHAATRFADFERALSGTRDRVEGFLKCITKKLVELEVKVRDARPQTPCNKRPVI